MKDIKFRAWNKKYSVFLGNVVSIDFEIENIKIADQVYKETHTFDEIILEQYTGLKDKNGVEIYEGDIYTFKSETDPDSNKEIVKNLRVFWLDYYLLEPTDIEVIGNIHENGDSI